MIYFRLSLVICFALAFKGSLCGSALSVGVAKVDVTPKGPVLLAGYGGRTTEHQGVDTPLWARALVIGDEKRVAVVALDNCGVPQDVTNRLAKRLAKHGISSDRLVVAATHTHNAPTLVGYAPVVWAGRTTPEQDRRVAEYTEFVIDKMEEAVLAALDRRKPMQLEWAQGRATFGGNRRVIRDGKWAGFGFQQNAPVDHSMPVLAARDSSGRVRAVWANYACHCTTVGSRNRVGGDWAGFANEWMEKEFAGAVSLMTIGCGADVGPQPSGSLQTAEEHGRSIAAEAKRLLTDGTISLGGVPSVVSRRIQLPLTKPKPREHWQAQLKSGGFDHQLAKAMLAKLDVQGSIPAEVSYPLSVWKFGDELAMVFLAEGGYEADFSQVYYEQPGRYDPGVEDKLVQAVRELVGEPFEARADQKPSPYHKLPSGEALTFKRLADWVTGERTKQEIRMLQKLRDYVQVAQPAVGVVSQKGSEETEWSNYAGDHGHRRFIRQLKIGTELEWLTLPAPKTAGSNLVYYFSGGVGWETETKTDGFALVLNGEEKLRFDVTRQLTRWVSEDGTVELTYLPTWTSNVDSGGFFFVVLTGRIPVDRNGVVPFAVRSLGHGSKRWFALDTQQPDSSKLLNLGLALD